jgi:RNA polymerase sigma-70 factor, ECF subfamily
LEEDSDPAARFDMKESVALAFIAATQLLPPRQRAVLLMRDVLAWSAREVSDSLECSVASVKSALQRARSTVRASAESGAPGTSLATTGNVAGGAVLARFMDAWERCDFDALASVLRKDAIMAMPPAPSPGAPLPWFAGGAAIADFFTRVPADGHLDRIRLVPVAANRQPALAAFIADAEGDGHRFYGLMVFAIEGNEVAAITGFGDPGLSDYFGLPSWIPSESTAFDEREGWRGARAQAPNQPMTLRRSLK